MDDLDFSAPGGAPRPRPAETRTAQDVLYSPALALEFFQAAGTHETKPASKAIFEEHEKAGGFFSKGPRMYLLLEGEVALMVNKRFFGVVKPGEIFGELAVIAHLARSATAMAKVDCSVLSLDEKQFQSALQKKPEFALMLMSIMVQRLRQSLARLAGQVSGGAPADRSGVFDRKALAEISKELGDRPPAAFNAGATVVSAGAVGAAMFIVSTGQVAISVGDTVVETIGPGGMFGEMALVDRSARAANAVAVTDAELFPVTRNDFLELVRARPAFGASLLRTIAERMQQLAEQVARAGV